MSPTRLLLGCTWLLGALATGPTLCCEPLPFDAEVAALESRLSTSELRPGAIVFAGSSSIRLWTTVASDFPTRRCINVGFGGAKIAEVTHYAPKLILPLKPRQIVFYCGTNDLADGHSAEQAFADFQTFAQVLREALPETRLSFISCAPNPARWNLDATMRQFNSLVATWMAGQPEMEYIDVHTVMLNSDGKPRPELFVEDKLHMNATGYALWRELVGPHLTPEP